MIRIALAPRLARLQHLDRMDHEILAQAGRAAGFGPVREARHLGRSSSEPPKYLASVRTERASAPAAVVRARPARRQRRRQCDVAGRR